jgi:Zn-dependent protease
VYPENPPPVPVAIPQPEIAQTEILQPEIRQPPPASGRKKWGVLGTIGAFLFKFKTFLLLALTKGKLVLLGLTKLNTLLSMLASIGLYWALYGWKFGVGFVLSIYIHEMGHVMALARYGIAATAPMFIPGFGAFIRLKAYPANVGEDARTGLAGPLWGLGAALACMGVWVLTGSGLFGALAKTGAWINVFNLIPIWQLDGGRGFRALTRQHRMIVAATALLLWIWTSETMLLIIALASVYRLFTKDAPETPDQPVLYQFVGLMAALAGVYYFTG